jgi:hypothetical protein
MTAMLPKQPDDPIETNSQDDDDHKPYTSIPILAALDWLLQNKRPLICSKHGKVYRMAWVCEHVAMHEEHIQQMERPVARPPFNPRYKIGIITCQRERHAQSEFVVVCEKCIYDKIRHPVRT